jgi:hypothetical protein
MEVEDFMTGRGVYLSLPLHPLLLLIQHSRLMWRVLEDSFGRRVYQSLPLLHPLLLPIQYSKLMRSNRVLEDSSGRRIYLSLLPLLLLLEVQRLMEVEFFMAGREVSLLQLLLPLHQVMPLSQRSRLMRSNQVLEDSFGRGKSRSPTSPYP